MDGAGSAPARLRGHQVLRRHQWQKMCMTWLHDARSTSQRVVGFSVSRHAHEKGANQVRAEHWHTQASTQAFHFAGHYPGRGLVTCQHNEIRLRTLLRGWTNLNHDELSKILPRWIVIKPMPIVSMRSGLGPLSSMSWEYSEKEIWGRLQKILHIIDTKPTDLLTFKPFALFVIRDSHCLAYARTCTKCCDAPVHNTSCLVWFAWSADVRLLRAYRPHT